MDSFLSSLTSVVTPPLVYFILLVLFVLSVWLFFFRRSRKVETGKVDSHFYEKLASDQFEILMRNVSDLILQIDLNGTIIYANRSPAGLSNTSIIGKNIAEILGEEILKRYLHNTDPVTESVDQKEYNGAFNGVFFKCRLLPTNLFGEGVLLACNISEKVSLRNTLTDSQAFFEGFVEALPGVAYRKELDDYGDEKYTFISHRVSELTGYSVEEFMSHKIDWSELVDKEDFKRVSYQSSLISPEEPLFSVEYKIKSKSGEVVWLLNQAYTTFENRRAVRREGIILDITNQKRSQSEVYELNKELKELKFAIDNTSLVTITDLKGRIKYVNDKFVEISGYSREESIGEKHNLVNSSFHHSSFWADLWTTISAGRVWNGEIKNKKKDGDFYWVNTFIVPIKDSENEIKEYLSIRSDVTEKKRQAEENRMLSLVAKETSNYVMITNAERKIEWVNEAFENDTGYLLKEIINQKPGDFLQGEHTSTETIEEIRTGLNDQKSFTAEVLNYKKNGTPYWVSINFEPIFDENGNLIKYFSLMRNITVYKDLVAKLEESVKRAEKSDELKTTFLANVSHEVRTPMNAIIGFSELLSMNTVSAEKVKYFSNIIKQRSKDLLSIFNDMLDTSKLVSGQAQLNLSTGCLENLMRKIYTIHLDSNQKLKSKRLDFKVNIDIVQEDLQIKADFIKLHQVLDNLITNSIKFTENGVVEFGCKRFGPGELLFYVTDTGKGIAQELHAIIFEAFRQTEETHISHGGSGLGLAICKGYVELMGGEIWLESKIDEGSTFYFTIPIN